MASRPRLKRGWEGRYVRLRHEVRTQGGAIFEAGEVMRVERNHGGLHLAAVRRCEHCKRRSHYRVRGVRETEVELLPEDFTPGERSEER